MTTPLRMDRRTALRWMFAAAASSMLASRYAPGQTTSAAQGYGTDPDLHRVYKPGELWPLTFTESQRETAAALSDVIIPADDESPSASAVGIVDFLDEWISAPYPDQVKDRAIVLYGLEWIDLEARKRFGLAFGELTDVQKSTLCDDICDVATARSEFKKPAGFFAAFRRLTTGGFYSTPQGRKDLRYVGNTPLITFDGPPPEVLRQAGVL
jgi:hypothetical protein